MRTSTTSRPQESHLEEQVHLEQQLQQDDRSRRERFGGPLIVAVIGLLFSITSGVVGSQFDDAELYAVSSATEFTDAVRETGNDARSWTLVDAFLTIPGFTMLFGGLLMVLRRVLHRPKVFDRITSLGFVLVGFSGVANVILDVAILLGLGRVDLDDAAQVIEPASAMINTIQVATVVNGLTFVVAALTILLLGVTLLVRRFVPRLRPASAQ